MKKQISLITEPDTTATAPHQPTTTKPHQEWDLVEMCPVGRDPRTMALSELAALGFQKQPLTEAVRAKCVDCCCGAMAEVRRCAMRDCPLWPFRMGVDPWGRVRSIAQKAASLANLPRAPKNLPKVGKKNLVTPFPGVRGAPKASAGNLPTQADNPGTVTSMRRTR